MTLSGLPGLGSGMSSSRKQYSQDKNSGDKSKKLMTHPAAQNYLLGLIAACQVIHKTAVPVYP